MNSSEATHQESLTQETLSGSKKQSFFRRLLPFLGPAFIAAIAYVDPGNFATNIQAGARYGYLLVWVIFASNLMAMVIQSLSAKLGIATGKNLAEVSAEHDSRPVRFFLWIIAEVVAMATDVAEFIGAALGLHLLFGMPMFPAVIVTGIGTMAILALQHRGTRAFEAVITIMIGIISACYLIQLVMEPPTWSTVGHAMFPPKFDGTESVVLAVGILGATVMPHVIYLHSALVQRRIPATTPDQKRRLFRFEVMDIVIAMSLAGVINAAMLVMAATTFFEAGLRHIASIEEAHRTLEPLVGSAASSLFGVSLLASGLASASVGTMAGQMVMEGFMGWHMPLWIRRLITMAPSFVVVGMGLDTTDSLIASQVILSFGIPFALVPLVRFTADRKIMGDLVNRKTTTALAVAISGLIIALNMYLLWDTFTG